MRPVAIFRQTEIEVTEEGESRTFPVSLAPVVLALCGPVSFRRPGEVVRYPELGVLSKLEGLK